MLYFEDKTAVDGMHAFVAGVSLYPNLPVDLTGVAPGVGFGMTQLTSTGTSAYRIAQWLVANRDKLVKPLASVRLLLSPQASEVASEPEMAKADACSLTNFLASAQQWRSALKGKPNSASFFYFAGHGIQRTKEDSVLLLEGFGDPVGGALFHAVDTHNIFFGMAPSADPPDMPMTQFYFVDACRNRPSQISNFSSLATTQVFNIPTGGADDRVAPIFYAAAANTLAGALPGKQTIFSLALLRCLSSAAAVPIDEDASGDALWGVTVFSLNQALEAVFRSLPPAIRGDQEFMMAGNAKDCVLMKRDDAPMVDVQLLLDPGEAAAVGAMEIFDAADKPAFSCGAPIAPHPLPRTLPAGYYRVRVSFTPPNASYRDCSAIKNIQPLTTALTIRVTA